MRYGAIFLLLLVSLFSLSLQVECLYDDLQRADCVETDHVSAAAAQPILLQPRYVPVQFSSVIEQTPAYSQFCRSIETPPKIA